MLSVVTSLMKGAIEELPSFVVSQISAPLLIKKCVANVRAKAAMFQDLVKIQTALHDIAPAEESVHCVADMFHRILQERCEFFEEENVLDAREIASILKSETFSGTTKFTGLGIKWRSNSMESKH